LILDHLVHNSAEEGSIEQLVVHIETHVGPIVVAVFNLGAQIGDRGLASTTLKQFEMGRRMATFGLFHFAQVLLPYMEQRDKGPCWSP
jgi:NAD(P)-dependent dehydrogenase (short-subunit alcohol dehydrogenase family)